MKCRGGDAATRHWHELWLPLRRRLRECPEFALQACSRIARNGFAVITRRRSDDRNLRLTPPGNPGMLARLRRSAAPAPNQGLGALKPGMPGNIVTAWRAICSCICRNIWRDCSR